jgi:two-component system cell cycle response regulator DivK
MVAEYLQFRGFAVRQVPSGSEALQVARRELPRIILMDLSMPGVDGWEATRQLKADPNTREAIVIAVTAHALNLDEQKARDAGCDGFIAKPFDLSALADGLERVMVLGRRGLAFLPKISHAAPKQRKDVGT